jgi:predicted Zn-dependent peptidase
MATEIHKHIARLQAEALSETELSQVRSRAKADLVRQLSSRQGLGVALATYHCLYGDWRELFRAVERIDRVTAADIQRAAREYLKAENRTMALLVKDESELGEDR